MYVKYVPDPEVIHKFFQKVVRGEVTPAADKEVALEGKTAREMEGTPVGQMQVDVSYATPHEVLKEYARTHRVTRRKVQKRRPVRKRASSKKVVRRRRAATTTRKKRSTNVN